MSLSKTELNLLRPLLQQDWDSEDDLLIALVDTLEEARASKVSYAGVIQLDVVGPPMYAGIGHFPGFKSAKNAVVKHPAAGLAKAIAVVPVVTPKGLTLLLDKVDAAPTTSKDWAIVKEDAALYRIGWDGKTSTREAFLKRLPRR